MIFQAAASGCGFDIAEAVFRPDAGPDHVVRPVVVIELQIHLQRLILIGIKQYD